MQRGRDPTIFEYAVVLIVTALVVIFSRSARVRAWLSKYQQ